MAKRDPGGWGVLEVPLIKRDEDGLMAAEADGERHLP